VTDKPRLCSYPNESKKFFSFEWCKESGCVPFNLGFYSGSDEYPNHNYLALYIGSFKGRLNLPSWISRVDEYGYGVKWGVSYLEGTFHFNWGVDEFGKSRGFLYTLPWYDFYLKNERVLNKGTVIFHEDYDGTVVTANFLYKERIFQRGGRKSKFWKHILPNLKTHACDVEYDREVGPRKSSWKGGTLSVLSPCEENSNFSEVVKSFAKKENLTVLSIVK
jgi:hypothetical protein